MTDVEYRFWQKVCKSADPNGCWVWTAAKDYYGYGVFSRSHYNKSTRAHRAIWEILNGEIPKGYVICHKCDNPPCVRPDHLFVGTHKENMLDKVSKGRAAGQKKGENHTQSFLTEADVIRIFELNQDGLTCRDIGKLLDIAEWSVSLILRGKRWGHVETPFRDKVKDNTYFTDEEVVGIFRRYKELGSMRKLAAELGRDSGNVYNILSRKYYSHVVLPEELQFEIKPSVKLTAEDIPVIFQLFKDGLSMLDIANRYDLDVSNIGLILNRKTWKRVPIPDELIPNIKPPNAKLDPDKVVEIFRGAALGVSRKELAKMFGVHIGTIKQVLARKVWQEVEIPEDLILTPKVAQ